MNVLNILLRVPRSGLGLLHRQYYRVSREKATLLVGGLINLGQAFGWMHLSPEQLIAVNTSIAAVFGVFWRDRTAQETAAVADSAEAVQGLKAERIQ
ncbi:MAG TPA: hypothetical protein VGS22_16450 [Thermoanaerobaculia bacterium]|jgi:hypothetical protein|nr:hypothetical protein [Thermoanaerobaculia bacterium]